VFGETRGEGKGEFDQMWIADIPSGLLCRVGPPMIVLIMFWFMLMLPSQVLTFLTAWLFASLPIGVVIGHCVVNDD